MAGGAPDAVLEGENGFVVDGRDVAQVAARCSELLLDRDLAARFGARGRQWVAERWRWDDLALRLDAILAGQPVDDPEAVEHRALHEVGRPRGGEGGFHGRPPYVPAPTGPRAHRRGCRPAEPRQADARYRAKREGPEVVGCRRGGEARAMRAQRALRAALHRHAGAGHAGNQRSWAWKLSVMVRWKTDSKPT